jgi:Tol biopolymer transport system component
MRRTLTFAPVLLIAFTTACKDSTEPEEPLPTEELGIALEAIQGGGTYGWWWPLYVWAPDGTEIFYRPFIRTTHDAQLMAVNMSDESTRLVADIDFEQVYMLRAADDGPAIVYSTSDRHAENSAIYRVSIDGASTEILVESARSAFAIPPDGSVLAYAGPRDTETHLSRLYVLTTADGAVREIPQDVSYVVDMAPDGTEVLHGSSPSSELFQTSVEDGSTVTIWSDDSFERRLVGHRWFGGEIQLLYRESADLYIQDAGSAAARNVATLPGTPETVAWSSDGGVLAAWARGECLRSFWWECEVRQFTLHLIDAESGSVTQIGQGNFLDSAFERPVDLRFSPDGSRLAFVYHRTGAFGPHLHMFELP